jgi:hypothetical protein
MISEKLPPAWFACGMQIKAGFCRITGIGGAFAT